MVSPMTSDPFDVTIHHMLSQVRCLRGGVSQQRESEAVKQALEVQGFEREGLFT